MSTTTDITEINGFPVSDGWVSEYFVTESGSSVMPIVGPFRSKAEVRAARDALIKYDPLRYGNTKLTEQRTPVDLFRDSEQAEGGGHA